MRTRLTDLTVRSLTEIGIHYDEALPAFGIRVGKHRKTWIVIRGKERIRTRIGFYPEVSLSEARRQAHLLLGTPFAKSTAPTFETTLDQFLEARQTALKPRSLYELKRSLNRHFHWKKALDKITHNDIAGVIDGIDAKSEAAHALKDIKTFFAWCVPRYLAHSPCEGLKPPTRYVPREKLLTDEEVVRIILAAKQMGSYGCMVQLLFATGQRANQIISLQDPWIDRDKRLIKFPASVMKGNRDHTLPYGDYTASLLDIGDRPTSYQGKKKLELDRLSNVQGWVLHDARRYYSSTQAMLKTPLDITETILAHVSGSRSQIQQIYDRYDRLAEMREAVEKYEKRLAELVDHPA